MNWIRHFVRNLRGAQALVHACLAVLFVAAASAVTPAAASPVTIAAPHQSDELRLPEGYLFPRNAVLQAALAPRPSRENKLGGFTPKLTAPAGVLVPLARPSLAPEVQLQSPATTGAHLWTWTSRAPPAARA